MSYTQTQQEFPSIMQPLVYERDVFLAYQISCAARALSADPARPQTVLAVVGMGHVQGEEARRRTISARIQELNY